MNKKTFFLIGLLVVLALGSCLSAFSQETPAETTEEVNLDEDVQPQDLEVGEPRILPGHPLYFLKNWGRNVRLFFAFRPVTKAQLREKFANEKLMELKKLITLKKNPEIIAKGIENYQGEIEKIKARVEKIKEKAKDNPKVEKFLDKFLHQQTLHQKLLSKLENQVPPEVFQRIKQARERHLERFKDVMLKLEDRREKLTEKLEKVFEKQKGSRYKHFKNLEILLELEGKVPEDAKEAIRKAQENTLKRLKEKLEAMSPEDQERFKDYLDRISGDKEKQLEILENLKSELKERPKIRERIIEKTRERILKRVKEKLQKLNCPEIEKPAPDFCKEGRIIIKKDEKGCIISFDCIVPAEVKLPEVPQKPRFCITLWNPVCGTDEKTYSNECFAELAGVEVAYKGACKGAEIPFKKLPQRLQEKLRP